MAKAILELDFKIEREFLRSLPYVVGIDNIHDCRWKIDFEGDQTTFIDAVGNFVRENELRIIYLSVDGKILEEHSADYTDVRVLPVKKEPFWHRIFGKKH